MTSIVGWVGAKKQMRLLTSCPVVTATMGEGVQKSKTLADFIREWFLNPKAFFLFPSSLLSGSSLLKVTTPRPQNVKRVELDVANLTPQTSQRNINMTGISD